MTLNKKTAKVPLEHSHKHSEGAVDEHYRLHEADFESYASRTSFEPPLGEMNDDSNRPSERRGEVSN